MISNGTRVLLFLLAVLFGLIGLVLFFLPGWSAENFPWKISPMVAMTMGGWSLGNAFTAWHTAIKRRAALVYPGLFYLLLFGVFQTLVLVAFRERLVLSALLAWPYIVALLLSILAGGTGLLDWQRQREKEELDGPPANGTVRGLSILFVVFVGALSLIGVFAPQGSFATEGVIFPEPLTLFTLRAFTAFYASLACSVIPLIGSKHLQPYIYHGKNGLSWILTILVATLVYLGQFDFSTRPGGLIYIGAYVIVLVFLAPILWRSPSGTAARDLGL